MAYNTLSGTVIAAQEYLPGDLIVGNILSGNLSTSDGSSIINVPRLSNATNNAILTNVGGDANDLTCESNLTFDGDVLNVTGDFTASIGVKANFFEGDGSRLTGISAGTGSGDRVTATAAVNGTTLTAGFNYFTGTLGTAVSTMTVSLPEASAPTVGDLVHLKAPSNCSTTRIITIATSGSHKVDGVDSIVLDSPYAAVSIVYASSGSWLIY
jgi:hypothetical protein